MVDSPCMTKRCSDNAPKNRPFAVASYEYHRQIHAKRPRPRHCHIPQNRADAPVTQKKPCCVPDYQFQIMIQAGSARRHFVVKRPNEQPNAISSKTLN
jgi:hypothetical protein